MTVSRKVLILTVASVLAASSVLFTPARAAAPEVPARPNIVDPIGDANAVNDQGFSSVANGMGPGYQGNVAGGPSLGVADIVRAWFSHTSTHVSAHIQTLSPPPNVDPGAALIYRVMFNPDPAASPDGCTWFQAIVEGRNYLNARLGSLRELCKNPVIYKADLRIDEAGDGTGIITITIPRTASPAFESGSILRAPRASSRLITGGGDLPESPTAPQIDNTLPGTDYVMSDAAYNVSDNDQPKKNCKKKKGKAKKKCKKKNRPKPSPTPTGSPSPSVSPTGAEPSPTGSAPAPAPNPCANPYTPGEAGAEAPLSVVTAEHTEEAPLEVEVEVDTGFPDVTGLLPALAADTHHNVQVATPAATGLYVRLEFSVVEDLDLYLDYADGSEAAHAAGFNPTPFAVAFGCCDGTGNGGHSEMGAEQLDGIKTDSCNGYTVRIHPFMNEGGTYTLLMWAGEPQNDPAPPGGGGAFSR